jgi:hypothetical protein
MNPKQGPSDFQKVPFSKNSNFTFALCQLIQDTLISIVGRWPNIETPTKLAYRDETLLIVLVNVVRLFGGTVLPEKLGDTYAVVSTTNWDYAAALEANLPSHE